MAHPRKATYDTTINNSVINELEVEHTENLVLDAEHADISSAIAIAEGETASILAAEAEITATTANVTAEVLHQNIQQDTRIQKSSIGELDIERAENVVAAVDRAEIYSAQTAVTDGQSFITTAEAQICTNEANVSADILHQNITHETNIQNSPIENLHAVNVVVNVSKEDLEVGPSERSSASIQQHASPKPPWIFSIAKGGYVEKFKRLVNERTANCTESGIVDGYKEQNLVEPSFEVYPILKEVKSFYSGGLARSRAHSKKLRPSIDGEESVGADHLIDKLQKEGAVIALVGQAGSGKSTLLKRIARELLKTNNLNRSANSGKFSGLFTKKSQLSSSFEIVYFINIRDIPASNEITVPQMLFGKIIPSMNKKTLYCGFKWLVKNQTKALFILDGLDQATWSLGESANQINYDDSVSTSTVMHNMLAGNLFPHVHILLSSREHVVSSLPKELRPECIFSLAGLTLDARRRLFDALLGLCEGSPWDFMSSKSPGLVPLCSIPIFLVFNALVYKAYLSNPPDTMSGVMIKVLQILIRSEHAREGDIRKVLKRLKEMAFKGTVEKRVLFAVEDLSSFGLDAEQVQDLVIKIPSYSESRILSQKLLQGDFSLYFCHQSIQEMLTALHIAEMDLDAFRNFVENTIHHPHWSVVRKFVCGVLLNQDTCNDASNGLMTVADAIVKQAILKNSLTRCMEGVVEPSYVLELFSSLYESNDGEFIQTLISEIRLEHKELNSSEMHTVASVLRRCKHLDLLYIQDGYANAELIKILSSSLKNAHLVIDELRIGVYREDDMDFFLGVADIVSCCRVKQLLMDPLPCCPYPIQDMRQLHQSVNNGKMKIKRLEILGDKKIYEDEIKLAASVVKHCKVETVVFVKTGIVAREIRIFSDEIKDTKIRELAIDVPGGIHAGVECFTAIAELVSRCDVAKLRMDPLPYRHLRQVNAEEIISFYQVVSNGKMRITELDVSGNIDMTDHVMGLVGCIVRLCQVGDVTMRDCQLNAAQVNSFQASLQGTKIRKLDIRSTANMKPACFKAIGDVVQKNAVEVLAMEPLLYCKLLTREIQPFSESVSNGMMEISSLSIKQNVNLTEDDFAAIGAIVRDCKVKKIKMDDCHVSANTLDRFLVNVRGARIKSLSVCYNRAIGIDGLSVIGKIVHECEVRKLLMIGCKLNNDELRSFKESVGSSKIDNINMGLSDIDPEGLSVVGSIARQCNIDHLSLSVCNMDSSGLQRLGESIGDLKMSCLSLNGNAKLAGFGEENVTKMIDIARRCQLEKLCVKFCDFNEKQIKNLRKSLRNTVIRTEHDDD